MDIVTLKAALAARTEVANSGLVDPTVKFTGTLELVANGHTERLDLDDATLSQASGAGNEAALAAAIAAGMVSAYKTGGVGAGTEQIST